MRILTNHWIVTTCILILAGVWTWTSSQHHLTIDPKPISTPRQGFLAPDFTLETIDGNLIRLSDLRGQPLLINFWATWCPPCRAEMPAMQDVYADNQHLGFEILAINATNQDNLANVSSFVSNYALTFPILLDQQGEAAQKYQIRSYPTSFFIDEDGIIQEVIIGGPMAEALLRIRIGQLIGEMQ